MGNRVFAAAVVFASIACGIQSVRATEVIFSQSGGSGTFTGGIVAGASFGAPNGATFNSLGVYDGDHNGLNSSYQVGLFDTTSQTLLASTTVTGSSPLIGDYRYASIPTTTIPVGGNFTIAAVLPTTNTDGWTFNASLNLGPGFTGAGIGKFFGSNVSLVFPASNDGVTYNVVNASDQVVPEPASLAALGASLLVLRRKRRLP